MKKLKLIDESKYIARGKCKDGLDIIIQEHLEKYGVRPELIFMYPKTLKKLFPDFDWESEPFGVLEYEGIRIIKAKGLKTALHWGGLPRNKEQKP